jgi:hypothetical protein
MSIVDLGPGRHPGMAGSGGTSTTLLRYPRFTPFAETRPEPVEVERELPGFGYQRLRRSDELSALPRQQGSGLPGGFGQGGVIGHALNLQPPRISDRGPVVQGGHLRKAARADPVSDLRTRVYMESTSDGAGNLLPAAASDAHASAVSADGQEALLNRQPAPRPDNTPPVGPAAQQEGRSGTQFQRRGAHRFICLGETS